MTSELESSEVSANNESDSFETSKDYQMSIESRRIEG